MPLKFQRCFFFDKQSDSEYTDVDKSLTKASNVWREQQSIREDILQLADG
jgi:hypothetical protein